MLLSIVTVCLNAEQLIGRTIDSVLRQDADDYEYLIIDGASTDRTLAIAESYRPAFDAKGIRYTIVSERDSGIYNAMNKGARLASGEWINYMNAGDAFFEASTLRKFRPALMDAQNEVVYGGALYLRGEWMRFREVSPPAKIRRDKPFCHQSAFTRTELQRQRPFDERYKICADYDFFLWLYARGHAFSAVNEYAALFVVNGYSATHRQRTRLEWLMIRYRNHMIGRKHFAGSMARWALESVKRLFLSDAGRQRLEEARYAKQPGWVKNEYPNT